MVEGKILARAVYLKELRSDEDRSAYTEARNTLEECGFAIVHAGKSGIDFRCLASDFEDLFSVLFKEVSPREKCVIVTSSSTKTYLLDGSPILPQDISKYFSSVYIPTKPEQF